MGEAESDLPKAKFHLFPPWRQVRWISGARSQGRVSSEGEPSRHSGAPTGQSSLFSCSLVHLGARVLNLHSVLHYNLSFSIGMLYFRWGKEKATTRLGDEQLYCPAPRRLGQEHCSKFEASLAYIRPCLKIYSFVGGKPICKKHLGWRLTGG